jgi:hypothetical protein
LQTISLKTKSPIEQIFERGGGRKGVREKKTADKSVQNIYWVEEMRYFEIRKEMSSLYCGLTVFRPFEARVPKFDTQLSPPLPIAVDCIIYTLH